MSLRALRHSAAHQGDWSAEPERVGALWLARQQQTRAAWEHLVSGCKEVRAAGAGGLGARSLPPVLDIPGGGCAEPGCGPGAVSWSTQLYGLW